MPIKYFYDSIRNLDGYKRNLYLKVSGSESTHEIVDIVARLITGGIVNCEHS